MKPKDPLKVAVLIDHRPNHPGEVGGLAGTWERLSRVALETTDVDLTLFFIGDEGRVLQLGKNVRYILVPPALGTERFGFLRGIPTNTDLAPVHPGLFRRLRGFDVLHTTDAFHAFAKTAFWRSRLHGVPLFTSIQTDIIAWARIYTPAILEKILPGRSLVRWLLEEYRYLDRQERSMTRRLGRYLRQCQAVFVSHGRDEEMVHRLAPSAQTFLLRRGIDLDLFNPRRRDREGLCRRFGIPAHCTLLLFVGRIDPVKGAVVAAQVVKGLVERGRDTHLLLVGDGSQREDVAQILGQHATFTGNLPHEELGWIYASSDLLLFPSEAEVWPNVVMEARACGLPVMACERGAAHVMEGRGRDGILLPSRDREAWLSAAESLLARPDEMKGMGLKAREVMERDAPSWRQVLEEDLLPVWRRVAGSKG